MSYFFNAVEGEHWLLHDVLQDGRGKYTSIGRLLMVIVPLPSFTITRAMAALRRPTALTVSMRDYFNVLMSITLGFCASWG